MELEQEVQQLRVDQAAQQPVGAPGRPTPPEDALPTDPDAIAILVNDCETIVAKCGEPEALDEARKFREAADSNKDFLAVLFNAIRWKAAAAIKTTAVQQQLQQAGPPVHQASVAPAPGVVGDTAAAATAADDHSMERAPKRTAGEAKLPETPAILLERERLLADLGLQAAAAALLADEEEL